MGETSVSIKNLNIPEDLMEFCIFHKFEIDELNNQLISRVEHKLDLSDFNFVLPDGDELIEGLTKILNDPEVYDEELSEIHNIVLSYILIALLFQKKIWYRNRVTKPISIIVASIGFYWFFERLFF